jgi:hypothetical protein
MTVEKPGVPVEMLPLGTMSLDFDGKSGAEIQKYRIEFSRCMNPGGVGPGGTYAAKPQVLSEGHALFPELAVLFLFKKAGWEGVWADPVGKKYFEKMPNKSKGVTLDTRVSLMLSRIAGNCRMGRRCWSLILWRGKNVFFVLVKDVQSGEKLAPAELDWIRASVRSGLSENQLIIVEWDYKRTVAIRKRRQPSRSP